MKKELLELYINAIEDATGWFLSCYYSSPEEKEERLKDDEEQIKYFINILKQI